MAGNIRSLLWAADVVNRVQTQAGKRCWRKTPLSVCWLPELDRTALDRTISPTGTVSTLRGLSWTNRNSLSRTRVRIQGSGKGQGQTNSTRLQKGWIKSTTLSTVYRNWHACWNFRPIGRQQFALTPCLRQAPFFSSITLHISSHWTSAKESCRPSGTMWSSTGTVWDYCSPRLLVHVTIGWWKEYWQWGNPGRCVSKYHATWTLFATLPRREFTEGSLLSLCKPDCLESQSACVQVCTQEPNLTRLMDGLITYLKAYTALAVFLWRSTRYQWCCVYESVRV